MKYHELRVPVDSDPLHTVLNLVDAAGYEPYVVYESSGCWSYAGGAAYAVNADGTGFYVDGRRQPSDGRHPLVQAGDIFQAAPIENWHVYGWAAFELGAAWPTETEGILYSAVIPEVEVQVSDAGIFIRALNPAVIPSLKEAALSRRSHREHRGGDLTVHGMAYTFRRMVESAVEEIGKTDLQKVILSRRLDVDGQVDLCATYDKGRRANTPARSFLFDLGGLAAAGFSPETVLELNRQEATVQIVAGTRSAGEDDSAKETLQSDLKSDPKEIYEHAISVDETLREIGEISVPGTARVSEFLKVVHRGSVQHLGSRIEATLAENINAWKALSELFPGAASTGVPRRLAAEAIGRMEKTRRGLYGGAVFACDVNGNMDVALALRSVFSRNGSTWLQVGAGVTSCSHPAREYEETCEKLQSIVPFLVAAESQPHDAD
ncbi:salicylate synthase [Streptomyces sp. NPDC048419]|uniref:salicylate synthase n=1 Tax=Streptomyces sp. NPDC048419 TaxID=3365547 RepID=UPI003724763C